MPISSHLTPNGVELKKKSNLSSPKNLRNHGWLSCCINHFTRTKIGYKSNRKLLFPQRCSFCPLQVEFLRNKYKTLDIGVDGGVGPNTIQQCADVSQSDLVNFKQLYHSTYIDKHIIKVKLYLCGSHYKALQFKKIFI